MKGEGEPIVGRRVVGPVREGGEADHFIACGCGQLLDMRRIDQVLMHEAEGCPLGPKAPPPGL